MITVREHGALLKNGQWADTPADTAAITKARSGTIAHAILTAHATPTTDDNLAITFDAMASHDITYVGIVQTARASGMKTFPLPYVLTNCHNSLCAVGGTINEDDHIFGLSAARKYGGDFVPTHIAVIHQYMREMFAGCGKMILGSDSHTRYGAIGTLAMGEGGPELVKQLLGRTYDIKRPDVVAVWLEGHPQPGVGPQDVALALIKTVFASGIVKNRILEFLGPGIQALSVDYRMGIDVMTTETTCLSSIWQTDEATKAWLTTHGRESDYKTLNPAEAAWYDAVIHINLSAIEPMIALPFHPSNAWTIREFLANAEDLLDHVEKNAAKLMGKKPFVPSLRKKYRNKEFFVDQCIIAGCSGGTYENLVRVAEIAKGHALGGNGVDLAVYPASQPQYLELVRAGHAATLLEAGATLKTAFCGPCFGAGDVPANGCFSIRHCTRNFPNREGSNPASGQLAYVALMDARSIAATAINGGKLTPATELKHPPTETRIPYSFDSGIYAKRVYAGHGNPQPSVDLVFGPNIADWPAMIALPDNLLLEVASAIYDPITTTDELIPSGETSSYRSNPLKLAEFTLSRKDPSYVERAKLCFALESLRRADANSPEVTALFTRLDLSGREASTGIGSVIFAVKPGDGSAREQAASCQKVLGGWANIAEEYATKRYRSNLINWGMLPFVLPKGASYNIQPNDFIYIHDIRNTLEKGLDSAQATLYQKTGTTTFKLKLLELTEAERNIILSGCLINYYTSGN